VSLGKITLRFATRGIGLLEFTAILVVFIPLLALGFSFLLVFDRLKSFEIFDNEFRNIVRSLETMVEVNFEQVFTRPQNVAAFNQAVMDQTLALLRTQGFLTADANCFLAILLFELDIDQNSGQVTGQRVINQQIFRRGQFRVFQENFNRNVLPALNLSVSTMAQFTAKRFPLGNVPIVHPLGVTWMGQNELNFFPRSFVLGYYFGIGFRENNFDRFAMPFIRSFFPRFFPSLQKTGLIPVLF